MTAINPARLKIQCAELGESFHHPHNFISGLHDLLAFYGARIRQTSLTKIPLSLQTYQVPAPVMRALELELKELINNFPDQGFLLADRLWQEEWLEIRQLGVILLGNIPTSAPDKILVRIKTWLNTGTSEDLKRQIMTRGLTRLTDEKPGFVLDFLKSLASSAAQPDRQGALFGLIPFAEDPEFDNLPIIFNILRDILLIEESVLRKEISALIRSLQSRTDQETAYFLVRQLATASRPRIFRITRQVLGGFSEESQSLLRQSLQNYL